MQTETQNLVALACAVGALMAAIVSPSMGGSACGTEEGIAALLPFVAALLMGTSIALYMRSAWRYLVVPVVSAIVLVVTCPSSRLRRSTRTIARSPAA